eukprot:TRINITY_DN15210_c0_g1_i1.p3 TRINITY_DN15210_c0_g1~~TRINITY_DN15210_c0_g1_i1.p3  ORF type:complete len:148 (-),score=12.17 TRINITY_DN15210_c0_g1_i1:346-789(-)
MKLHKHKVKLVLYLEIQLKQQIMYKNISMFVKWLHIQMVSLVHLCQNHYLGIMVMECMYINLFGKMVKTYSIKKVNMETFLIWQDIMQVVFSSMQEQLQHLQTLQLTHIKDQFLDLKLLQSQLTLLKTDQLLVEFLMELVKKQQELK